MAGEKVLPLSAADNVQLVGGKARSLNELLKHGFKTRDGFVVTTVAFERMDKALEAEILKAFGKLGAEKVAVRSSAVAEDGQQDAWAGQLETFLNIERDGLIEATKKCWASAGSERAKAYAKQKGIESGKVAVIIQPMTQSDSAGVAFSVHPVTKNKDQLVVEVVRDLGDKLVSGTTTPDTYIIDKSTLKPVEKHLVEAKPILSEAEIKNLAGQVIKLEKHYSFPVDVEWMIKGPELFIMQCRPITTLG